MPSNLLNQGRQRFTEEGGLWVVKIRFAGLTITGEEEEGGREFNFGSKGCDERMF